MKACKRSFNTCNDFESHFNDFENATYFSDSVSSKIRLKKIQNCIDLVTHLFLLMLGSSQIKISGILKCILS